ncbi:hypothetical protein R1sor_020898 [Riccia sorocarpa]|uniref:Dirigent protein n=1 Tax=Riccia sorocarpa TaxID=122646 RepID=A0ABD3GFH5_9MARC
MGSFKLMKALMVVTLILSVTSSFVHGAGSRPSLLVNYEFENRVPPNNTVVVSATPSGNLSTSEFGTVRVVTNVIRESIDKDSKVLGNVVGLVNSLKDESIYLTFDFVYNTDTLNGTIGIQGRLNAAGNGELEVTGGTGTFRFARGYCETTLVSTTDPANIVFKNIGISKPSCKLRKSRRPLPDLLLHLVHRTRGGVGQKLRYRRNDRVPSPGNECSGPVSRSDGPCNDAQVSSRIVEVMLVMQVRS